MRNFIRAFGFLCAALTTTAQAQDQSKLGIAVQVEAVEAGVVTQWLFLEGVAEAARKEFLYFQRPGRITNIANGADGTSFRAGMRVGPEDGYIARLDDRDVRNQLDEAKAAVSAAEERVRAAEAVLVQTQASLDRRKRLVQSGATSQSALDDAIAAFQSADAQLAEFRAAVTATKSQVRSAELALSHTELKAPFEGTISKMNIRIGDFVSESLSETAPAAREASSAVVLIDDSTYEVTLFVPPYQAVNVKEDQRVLVGLNGSEISKHVKSGANPLVTEATVWSVSPSVSLQNRAVEVKVRTKGQSTFLSDGDFVSAWIATSTKEDAVRVPYTALIDQDRKLFTFVVSEDGQSVEKRQIDAGIEGLLYLEALSGVSISEQIVTRGQHLLANGSPVRIIEEGN